MNKWLFPLCAILMIFPHHSKGQTSDSTNQKIQMAIDYAKSGLREDAKKMLINLIYEQRDGNKIANIRFALGSICFEEENYDCSNYHWSKVLLEYPNSAEAQAIQDILSNYEFFSSIIVHGMSQDFAFLQELQTSRRFWTYKPLDYKMDWKALKDSALALAYLNSLLEKYSGDDTKRAILLFDKFLIFAGCNEEGLGMNDRQTSDYLDRKKVDEEILRNTLMPISDSLKVIEGADDFYIRTQFIMGILTSGTKFLSSKIKINDKSAEFFENVVSSRKGDLTNPYRLFASIWLAEYHKKN